MKRQTAIEQLILNSKGGLTHREIAQKLGVPEPSVRRTLQVLRDHAPRFKVGQGMFDIVAIGERRFGNETSKQTVWRAAQGDEPVPVTRTYDPSKVTLTITGEDGVKREVSSSVQDVRIEKNEPGDFDSGSAKVA